eukprot:3486077-Pyramimonas_sp.AAC.1
MRGGRRTYDPLSVPEPPVAIIVDGRHTYDPLAVPEPHMAIINDGRRTYDPLKVLGPLAVAVDPQLAANLEDLLAFQL